MTCYVLHPGLVVSRTDGQEHFVGSLQLRQLYRVPKEACATDDSAVFVRDHPPRRVDRWGRVHLYPDPTGEYVVPVTATYARAQWGRGVGTS